MRNQRIWRIPALGLVLVLAGCMAADPSSSILASAAVASAPSPAAIGTPTVGPTSTPPPRPAGTLLVWQLDGTDGATATTESLFRLDLANGSTTPVARISVSEDTCCPTSLTLSDDRATAFLYAGNYRGAVEVSSGAFEKANGRIPRGIVAISHVGDRLAWVDDVTGTSESMVIAGRDGKRTQRIALPSGAFASIPAWAPGDDSLLVTTLLPLAKADDAGVRLASTIACCSIDRGVQATHLLVVPLDGGTIRDIHDDRAGVMADQAKPPATPPPGKTGGYAFPPSHEFRVLAQSPDGRTVVAIEEICPGRWGRFQDGVSSCTSELMTIDLEARTSTILPVPLTEIFSAGWSPDGRRLSLLGSAGGGPTGLYVFDAAGGSMIDLGDAEPELMAWSSDGRWIAFWRLDPAMKDGSDRVQVWVAPSTGGDARFVAAHATVGWLEP